MAIKQKQLPCFRVRFGSKLVKRRSMTSDMHGQVTHSFILTFIAFPLMLEGLFFPTHSFFLVSLPFYSTQVCLCTSAHLNIGQVSVKYRTGVLIQVYNIYYKHDSPVSRLYINQTYSLKARLWGKCHRHFPIFKKRTLPAVLFAVLSCMHLSSHMAANVGGLRAQKSESEFANQTRKR